MPDNPYIGRYVALLAPVIASLSLLIVNAVQSWIGIDLDGTQLTILLTGAVASCLGVVYKWLDNRGKWELATQIVDTGESLIQKKEK